MNRTQQMRNELVPDTGSTPVPVSDIGPVNILLVDDDPRNLNVLEAILDDPGYRLVRVESADQALSALIEQEFALLILDVRMPELSGFELAQIIKERKKTAEVPIIFLTAYYNEDQDVLQGYSSGAVDFLHKPVNPIILRSKVAVFVELHRQNRERAIANLALQTEITERRRAQQQLKELNETLEQRVAERTQAAEKANLAKSEFLSSMSHELRTPLNAILGFAQLMESSAPPPTVSQKRGIDQIVKAGWYLLELINEILDLALIESGKLPLWMAPISVAEVLRECKAMIEPQSETRSISTTFPVFERPCFVHADRTRLKQVLINLLSNAVKYNKLGGAVVVEYSKSTQGRILLTVKDTGEGMTPDQMTHLFQPFNRLGKEASKEEGTGIGLVMAKRLVELMGGRIGAESTVGEGSKFWIELDLADEPRPTVAKPDPAVQVQTPTGAQLHSLLYVEDSPANLMLVEEIIARRSDMRLLTAADGQHGIELALAFRPDVILIDINLPGINGTSVLGILADNPATANIPVIALSANAMPSDIEKGLQAGFFRYLTKPIKINELLFTLDVALKFAKMQSARTVN